MKSISIDSILLGPSRSRLSDEVKRMVFLSKFAYFRYVLLKSGLKLFKIKSSIYKKNSHRQLTFVYQNRLF